MAEPNEESELSAIDPQSLFPVPGSRSRPRGHLVQDDIPPGTPGRTDEERLATALEHACLAAKIASDNRAKDILLLDMQEVTPLVDFLVIASVASRRQGQAAASEIDAEMKKVGDQKIGMEGYEEGRWILVDYGDFVVHVLSAEAREYYALEELWGDAILLDWQTGQPIEDPDAEDDDDSDVEPLDSDEDE